SRAADAAGAVAQEGAAAVTIRRAGGPAALGTLAAAAGFLAHLARGLSSSGLGLVGGAAAARVRPLRSAGRSRGRAGSSGAAAAAVVRWRRGVALGAVGAAEVQEYGGDLGAASRHEEATRTARTGDEIHRVVLSGGVGAADGGADGRRAEVLVDLG